MVPFTSQMIDLSLYRQRVGVFNNNRKRRSEKVSNAGNCVPDIGFLSILKFLIFLFIYLYFAICMFGMMVCMLRECKLHSFTINRFHRISEQEHLHSCLTHSKLLSVVLVYFLLKRDLLSYRFFGIYFGIISKLSFQEFSIRRSPVHVSTSRFIIQNLSVMATGCLMWIVSINSALIVIANPSILNPGPGSMTSNSINVTSFNVQGLIPFSQLNEQHPSLDITKLCELNFYLANSKPDILMLNETWLKKAISTSEIFPSDYKIFRLDRSPQTHPPDQNNPNKFRKSGGGVLIAIRHNLDIISTKLESTCSAEMLGVTIKFRDGRKIILCSFYRVGTLGIDNHREFCDYIRKVRCRRGVCGIIVAGDLNMPGIDWANFSSSKHVDQLFLDSFSNFGLEQLVSCPTHIRGNILDLVLTDKLQFVSNLEVTDINKPCKSDHFAINFKIRAKVKRIKTSKRNAYNFKRADWVNLNSSLRDIDWERELAGDMEIAWSKFKSILFSKINDHVPIIKIGGQLQPPWFDAETHQLCRKKERLHSIYKNTEDALLQRDRYLKFSKCRKDFKELVSKKLGDSFDDSEDSNLITKKFWSYVKATSKNTRIPEMVHLDDVYKTDRSEQAHLFNNYFQRQFSEPSQYDIPIEDELHDEWLINFEASHVLTILKNLNPNKAIGPDKISGRVLKNCCHVLSIPLSILFQKSYCSGVLPSEWKLANIVPVHKKGSKSDEQNYRPISLTSLVVKVLERIVRDNLMSKCSDMLDGRQHGFLPEKSCSTQLIQFCDSLSLSLNKNIRSDVIYFDFAKAFDSVNHDLILQKLKCFYGINGKLLAFIRNYLKDRWQAVVVDGLVSSSLRVLSGVPQGSILGPSLFVLFINDISIGLSPGTNIMLYADDTKIWREMNDENDFHTMQKDIDYLLGLSEIK